MNLKSEKPKKIVTPRSYKKTIRYNNYAITIALMICAASPVYAADLCSELSDHSIRIVANGYEGVINRISVSQAPDGGYSFETTATFANEPPDPIVGTCKDRHLLMTRKRAGGFTQKFDGWIFEKKREEMLYQDNPLAGAPCACTPIGKEQLREVAGEFSHNGKKAYGWYGRLFHTPIVK